MFISQVYDKYQIPDNLQKHMYRVAAVGYEITENWLGPEIDRDLIAKALLLHDLGNIIKFDLDAFPKLLGDDTDKLDYWKRVQKKFIDQYGTNEFEATMAMMQELSVEPAVSGLVEKLGVNNLAEIVGGGDWQLRIAEYSDLRVAPEGVVRIDERFDDLFKRYKKSGFDLEKNQAAKELAVTLEDMVQSNCGLDITEINDEKIAQRLKVMQFYDV